MYLFIIYRASLKRQSNEPIRREVQWSIPIISFSPARRSQVSTARYVLVFKIPAFEERPAGEIWWTINVRNWFNKHKTIFAFRMISRQLDGVGSWNSSPWKTRTQLSLHNQCYGSWWPRDARSQAVNSRGVNLILLRYSGGRLNKKDGLTRYGDSHVKDKTS